MSKPNENKNSNESTVKDEKLVSESGKLETKPLNNRTLGIVRNNPNEYVLGVFYRKD